MDNQNNGYGPLLVFLSQVLKNSLQNPPARDSSEAGMKGPEDGHVMEEERMAAGERVTAGEGDGGMAGREAGVVYFAEDETGCSWRKEERVELLAEFCREGCVMAKKYGHFLVGTGNRGTFLAIPGRFLLAEQPAGGVTGFTLWQPLTGGELHYDTLETMSETAAESVYGYWIGRLDPETLKISEV